MLLLSRKIQEAIIIGNNVIITVLKVSRGKVRLGIEAPREIGVQRSEVYDLIQKEVHTRLEQEEETEI